MAATNEITGDRLINTPKTGPREGVKRSFNLPADPEFKVYYCPACNIKVSTSNDCCPCCGKNLT